MEVKTETQVVEQNAVTESVAAETPKRKTRTRKAAEKTVKPIVPKDIDPEQYVTVRNGFQGRLVYVSKHKLCVEIAKAINGSRKYGLGELELYAVKRFAPMTDFNGKLMTFHAKDFNMQYNPKKPTPINRKTG